ncbi:hypothetical protein UA08_06586 [Talaromyces atroroseus]|uniref:RING-type domain-containing protein n=1 Tax=Talaromyces atroroseus TaxID=1441469 RepID=A0A225AX93_TALAT|nr:hypothetical protein UA08_06586 [Talaromyces atroroseus]OKL58117.1 hypothetical protein UA08_06586 [Talaromyces atroroseus]
MVLHNGTDYTEHKSEPYPFIDPRKLNLEGKSVFITGASKGIGAAIATSYASAGASIIGLGARTSQGETVKAIAEAAKAAGRVAPKVFEYELDVTSLASIEKVAAKFRDDDANGRLDILVNNAGYLPSFVPIAKSDPDDWWRGWEVNVKGVYMLTRAMIPIMLNDRQSDRTIVTLTSTSAHRVSYGGSSYQMTKLVNLRFCEFIAAEYGQDGFLAYAVNPGRVATDMGEKVALDTGITLEDSPELCANTISFLTSEKRDWLQGRYISALWDMEKLLERRDEIVKNDYLKVRMVIGLSLLGQSKAAYTAARRTNHTTERPHVKSLLSLQLSPSLCPLVTHCAGNDIDLPVKLYGLAMSNDRQVESLATRFRKRPHIEMSHSHYQGRSQWPQHGEAGSSAVPSSHPLSLPTPHTRYQGHAGFDFRRPVMSTPSHTDEVVDLTDEPDSPVQFSRRQPSRSHSHQGHRPPRHRPPRFGRNIMADVVDLEQEDEGTGRQGETDDTIIIDSPSSPEVQFVRATQRPVPSTSSRLLDVLNLHARSGFLSPQEAFRQEIALRTRHIGQRRINQSTWEEIFFAGNTNDNIDLTIDLDYQAPGFSIHEPPAPTPPPAYEPPSPAPEGFTRTVSDADVVVCPNCDRELGTGDGLRQQIWVAKPCGHVYCGECTSNRAKKKNTAAFSALGTKPFSKCRVAGCEKLVSQPKSMVQIYL